MQPHWAGEHFLASDADRERTVEALKQNFQAGRIGVDELSERIGQALAARTFADLDIAMRGLPSIRANIPVYPNMPGYPPAPMFYQPAQAKRQRGMGITAFVLSLFGVICGITAVPAVVLGLVALAIDSERDDKGFAVAGVAVGMMWAGLFGLWFLS